MARHLAVPVLLSAAPAQAHADVVAVATQVPWWLFLAALALVTPLVVLLVLKIRTGYALRRAWRHMAPGVALDQYSSRWRTYDARKRKIWALGLRMPRVRRAEAALLPDNSHHFEDYEYRYRGLEETRAVLAQRTPVALVAWHHGALAHHSYGVARVLPQTAFFTRYTYQYGKVISYSVLKAETLTVFKMTRFLEQNRPVHYFIDGPPVGETLRLPVLWEQCDLSIGPLRALRSVAGLRLVPVTTYYGDGDHDRATVVFHPPLTPERLARSSELEILVELLSLFERDLRANAPEQVALHLDAERRRSARLSRRPRAGAS